MKHLLTIILSIFSLIFSLSTKAQSVNEGNILIDAYIGGPNLYTFTAKAIIESTDNDLNIKAGGVPLIGGRVSYMVADNISVGLDINYTTTSLKFDDQLSDSTVYNYAITIPRLRAMGRFEFHFNPSENFDFYWPIAVGFNSTRVKLKTDDPDFTDAGLSIPVPVAFRTGLGGRYFFNENLGLNLEFGLGGGALIQGGLSFKI